MRDPDFTPTPDLRCPDCHATLQRREYSREGDVAFDCVACEESFAPEEVM